MGFLTLLLLALALSMDAFAVSISNGMCYGNLRKKQGILMSFSFGFFQGIMPVIGFFAARSFSAAIQNFDHWIAFVLLSIIGGKMIAESIDEMRHPQQETECKLFSIKTLLMQSVATSIDALAVGVSFAFMKVHIIQSAVLISCVTCICSLIGIFLGKKIGVLFKSRAEIAGGLILIAIGLKIFIEHMWM